MMGEMRKNKPPSRLDLNSAISDDIDWQCKHFAGRGVRKLHESGTALAEDIEAPVSKMPDSIEAHFQASFKATRNPNGEPYPAFTSDKSWDEASGKTVTHRQVPLIQRVQKTVEVPRVQFIDRLVDDPAVMRREAFNIEARELIEDDPVGGACCACCRACWKAAWVTCVTGPSGAITSHVAREDPHPTPSRDP